MKKKMISLLLCMALAVSVTACGSSKDAGEEAETASSAAAEEDDYDYGITLLEGEEYDPAECVTLGDYKGMELTKTVKPVTDEDVTEKIKQLTGSKGDELTDPDATVQMGDTAVIDYTGKKDGVAFEGGTSNEPYDLVIGSGNFIPGFEEGVIGMKVGETKDIDLTFPENYHAADLAGAAVVFTVELHAIKRLEITDKWVEENAGSDYANAEEYIESNRKVLEEENEKAAQNQLYSDVWSKVMADAEFKAVPAVVVKAGEAEFEENVKQQADAYGYELDAFLKECGVSMEQYREQVHSYGLQKAKEQVVLKALLTAEGLGKDSDEYKAALDDMVAEAGAESAEDLIESYGQDQIDDMLLSTIVVERILTYATVTEA